MSAWIVSKTHIDIIIRGAIDRNYCDEFNADATGKMLWTENLKSVSYRYPNDTSGTRPGCCNTDEAIQNYEYTDPMYGPTDNELDKAIGCYDYQSCEHEEWPQSDAHNFVTALQQSMKLPERDSYPDDAGPWGWDSTDVAYARIHGHTKAAQY